MALRNESSRTKAIRELQNNIDSAGGDSSFSLRSSGSINSGSRRNTKRFSTNQPALVPGESSSYRSSYLNHSDKLPFRDRLANLFDDFKDQYRKIKTKPACDPYVKVTLKPTLGCMYVQ